MPVAINPPSLNIDAPNSFIQNTQSFAWIWTLLKGLAIILGVVLIVGLLILFIVWIVRALMPKPTPQKNIMSDKSRSCMASKQSKIKKVYRYDDKGMHLVGEYLGETEDIVTRKSATDIAVVSVLVGHPKVLIFLPRIIHNFVWQINFMYSLPANSVKYMTVGNENSLVLLSNFFKYDGNLKVYVSQDHAGLPKRMLEVFLNDVDREFLHDFVKTSQKAMNRAVEVNPYVVAEIKRKKEFEEVEGAKKE